NSTEISGLTVGTILSQPADVSDDAWVQYQNGVTALQSAGVQTTQVSLESLTQARQAAHIIGAAEFPANLAKFDGIRFGNWVTPDGAPFECVVSASCRAGCCYSTNRRIIIGTHLLPAGTINTHFFPAQKVRTGIINDYKSSFETGDAIA